MNAVRNFDASGMDDMQIADLQARMAALENKVEANAEDLPDCDWMDPTNDPFPFMLYVKAGKLCCYAGNHYWWNSFTEEVTITTLSETGTNSWPLEAGTVYVKRIYDTAGTATATLEQTADDVATVLTEQTATEARFIIGTFAAATGEGIRQRRLSGDIEEYRVA